MGPGNMEYLDAVYATFPSHLLESNKLSDMPVGGYGWIVPWGMVVDMNDRMYLNASYTFKPKMWGTSCVYVERHRDGYHVWVDRVGDTYKWDRSDGPWGKDIPVRTLHTESGDKLCST